MVNSSRLPLACARSLPVGALHEHGQVLGFEALGLGVEDEDALDDVAQLADVAGPVVLLERGEGGVGDFDAGAAVLLAELLRGTRARASGMSSLRSRSGGTKKGMTLRR